MYVCKEVRSASTQKSTDICEVAHNGLLYKSICDLKNMHICEHLHVHREVLTVSVRKGTDICEIAHKGLLYKSICDLKNMHTCEYLHVHKEVLTCSNCERSQGQRHM